MSGKSIVTEANIQTLSYQTDSLEKVKTALKGITEGKGFVEENRTLIIEGILQTVDSLIQYGQYRGFTSTFTLKLEMKTDQFRVVLCDNGNDVDLEEEITDTRLKREKNYSINTGLLRQVMDQISYNYKKGSQSELELVNYLP